MSNNVEMTQSTSLMVKVVTNILRPLIKMLIGRDITFPMLSEILKRIYVDVAADQFKLDDNKEVSDSRITLLTKVHRKDVRRLRDDKSDGHLPKTSMSLGSQIVAKWLAWDKYHDEDGEPVALYKLNSKASGKPSFEELVNSINNDIRPRVALDQLKSLNIVMENEDGFIILNEKAFIPSKNSDELIGHFNRNIHDHMAAAVHNIDGGDEPFLERAVFYEGLSGNAIEELKLLAEEQSMQMLVALNKFSHNSENVKPDEHANRMTFGVYFYSEKDNG